MKKTVLIAASSLMTGALILSPPALSKEIKQGGVVEVAKSTLPDWFIGFLVKESITGINNSKSQGEERINGSHKLKIKVSDINLDTVLIPGKLEGKAIILAHQYKGNKEYMLPQADFLHETGYTVILFDFRAHGKSDGNLISFGRYEKEDLEAVVSYARRSGYKKVGVLGVSMGASAALLSGNLDAVVADSPYAWLSERFYQDRGTVFGIQLRVWGVKLKDNDYMRIGEELAETLGFDVTKFSSEMLKNIATQNPPTLLIHADNDRVIPIRHSEEINKVRKNSHLWRIDSCQLNPSRQKECHIPFTIDSLYGIQEPFMGEYQERVIRFFNENL